MKIHAKACGALDKCTVFFFVGADKSDCLINIS